MARVLLLGALALHLCGAAIGPWAHAVSIAHSDPQVEEFHPGEPHVEFEGSGHEPCNFCQTISQPSLAPLSVTGSPSGFVAVAPLGKDVRVPSARRDLPASARAPPGPSVDRTVRA